MKQDFMLQRDLRRKQQLAENISPYQQQTIAVIRAKIEEKAYMVKHDASNRHGDWATAHFVAWQICSLARENLFVIVEKHGTRKCFGEDFAFSREFHSKGNAF